MANVRHQKEHVKLAKVFSSVFLIGPPMNDPLVEMVENLFTSEEAKVVANVPFYLPGSLRRIARKSGMTEDKAKRLLDGVSDRRVIVRAGSRYSLLPIIPGIFEYSLMNGDTSGWRRKYGEQIVEMFSTGYIRKYMKVKLPGIRSIPVEQALEPGNQVVDADLMTRMLDSHTVFAVANVCQCRQSMRFAGKTCSRASETDGCLVFGAFAEGMEKSGSGRLVTREEMETIVQERWAKNLVLLTANVSPESPNAVCTCCDCCCHALEAINHFGGMKFMAAPHFVASVDGAACNHCGRCVRGCNTAAHNLIDKIHHYDASNCIGCGVCIEDCKPGAIRLVENPAYKAPEKSFAHLGTKLMPRLALAGALAKLSDFKRKSK